MTSYQYRKSHCGDKTILRPSYLHNGISYPGKTTSLYWIGPQRTPVLTQLSLDKMAVILADDNFKCIFLDENDEIRFEFHWNVFPEVQLTISQHWIRQWLDTEQTTSHYLNQCWHSSLTHICGTRGRWINANMRPLRHQVFSKALLCNKIYYTSLTSHYAAPQEWASLGIKMLTSGFISCNAFMIIWQSDGMESLSALLALCEGTPSVTGGYPLQRASDAVLWC